jgi:hypothetical protein
MRRAPLTRFLLVILLSRISLDVHDSAVLCVSYWFSDIAMWKCFRCCMI